MNAANLPTSRSFSLQTIRKWWGLALPSVILAWVIYLPMKHPINDNSDGPHFRSAATGLVDTSAMRANPTFPPHYRLAAQVPVLPPMPVLALKKTPSRARVSYRLPVARLFSGSIADVSQLPPLEPGMVNVTDNGAGYHLQDSAHGLQLIAIGYDEEKIPLGYIAGDIHSFWYNPKIGRWTALKRDSIDVGRHIIYSNGGEDGDYINAIIKVPETPETQGYVPTTMNDIKVGDPASMVQLMQAPKVNNQGTADLTYNIEIPSGRLGLHPQITLAYNSNAANGWLGEGWSLGGFSAITVDTRWGVPRYDDDTETETYLLDGQMLAYASKEKGKTAHRAPDIKRTAVTGAGNITTFAPRKQQNFDTIQRIGSKPDNYYWLLIDKQGVKYYYGRDEQVDENALLRRKNVSPPGIAEWKLIKKEDRFGNLIRYHYKRIETPSYITILPDYIDYTLHVTPGDLTFHRIVFEFANDGRIDSLNLNARYGMPTNPQSHRLTAIKVLRVLDPQGAPQAIREYKLAYRQGAFGKTLLASLTQSGHQGTTFYRHDFNYYNEDGNDPLFSPTPAIVNSQGLSGSIPDPLGITNNKATAIGSSKSSGNSMSAYVGVGPPGNPTSVNNSVGIQYNNSGSSSKGVNSLIDIDGDGLPDKVFIVGNTIKYEKNISAGNKIQFSKDVTTISDVNQFMESGSRSTGWGAKAVFGAIASFDKGRTETVVNTYFADANGDGLMDIVKNGNVYFNTGKVSPGRVHAFNLYSSNTPSPVVAQKLIATTLTYADENAEMVANNPLQEVVRVWEAPYNGTVHIKSKVTLLHPKDEPDYALADGVIISIQHNTLEKKLILDTATRAVQDLDLSNLVVKKGEKIFFRVQSGTDSQANGSFDQVEWFPVITYEQCDVMGSDTLQKAPAVNRYVYAADKDFLLSNKWPNLIPDSVTRISFGGTFRKPVTMDSVFVEVIQYKEDPTKPSKTKTGALITDDNGKVVLEYSLDTVLFAQSFGPNDDVTGLNMPASLQIDTLGRKIKCLVRSEVNIDLDKVKWEPTITYDQKFKTTVPNAAGDSLLEGPVQVKPKTVPFIPHYAFNDTLRFVAAYDTMSLDTTYCFYPALTVNEQLDADFWFVVKTTQKVLAKKRLQYRQGRLQNTSALLARIPNGEPFIVSIESPDNPDGKEKSPTYTAMCKSITQTKYFLPGDTTAAASFSKADSVPPVANQFLRTITQRGNYLIIPMLTVSGDTAKENIRIRVLKNGTVVNLGAQDSIITVRNSIFTYPLNPLQLDLAPNDRIAVQFICANDTLINNASLVKKFAVHQTHDAEFWINRENETFGPMYRYWGQFVYNGMEGRASAPIAAANLFIREGDAAGLDVEGFRGSVNNAARTETPMAMNQSFDAFSVARSVFYSMVPYADSTRRCWLGGEDSIYTQPHFMSTSRLGIDNVKSVKPFASTLTTPLNGSYALAVPKVSVEDTKTYVFGASFLTKSNTKGNTEQVADYLDMNGDRYPDVLSKNAIQFTNPLGKLSDVVSGLGDNTHAGTNTADGVTVGGRNGDLAATQGMGGSAKPSMGVVSNSCNSSNAAKSADDGIGSIGSYNSADELIKSTWIDINGDGLPDKVSTGGFRLNLGYGKYQDYARTLGTITTGNNIILSPNTPAGFSFDRNSFSGGAGLSFSASKNASSFQDMNGDGMPDRITIRSDRKLWVAINTGSGFLPEKEWLDLTKGGGSFQSLGEAASLAVSKLPSTPLTRPWLDMEGTKFNTSNSVSLGGSATFGGVFLFFKIVFSPSFNHSESMGRTIRQFMDVNGDGYADYLYSTSENKMEVQLSTLGRSNKLCRVSNPLGGSFTLDYEHTDVTTEHPGGKWVLSQLVIQDGITEDRADTNATFDSKQQFVYSKGRYDRYEREFLGFGNTAVMDLDFKGDTVRVMAAKYDTRDYYKSGHLLEQLVRDGTDTAKKFTILRNVYDESRIAPCPVTSDQFTAETGIVFSPVKYTIKGTYEGTNTLVWQNKSQYFYTPYGDVRRFTYNENPTHEGDNSFDYQTTIVFDSIDLKHYIIGLPIDVKTQNADKSVTYRHMGAKYYPWDGIVVAGARIGHRKSLQEVYHYLDNTRKATTSFGYYINYGVISRKTLPNKLRYEYSYDRLGAGDVAPERKSFTFTYITTVETFTQGSPYNFSSKTDYDYRFGIPVATQDINGNYIGYVLDEFGRVVTVKGPKECNDPDPASCNSFTIQVDYSLQGVITSNKALARVTHFDENMPGIQTINISDGFNRSVQIKKTAVISNSNGDTNHAAHWIVSGRQQYDAMGRVVEDYYPTLDNAPDGLAWRPQPNTSTRPARTLFDVMDRPLQKIAQDDSLLLTTHYTIENRLPVIISTFINGAAKGASQVKKQFFNGSGLLALESFIDKHGTTFQTTFKYDPIHQLEQVTDPGNGMTRYAYDHSGRKLLVDHSAAGITQFTYDESGQLQQKITANNEVIKYAYFQEKLIGVSYSSHPENNVRYAYGTNAATINRNQRNRLVYQEDATGAQAFVYGDQGEIIENTRTIIAPFSNKLYTFKSSFHYDTWNRLRWMVYPDGDTVKYTYNRAGLLESVKSKRKTSSEFSNTDYVSQIGYDAFEQRVFMKYGNNTQTSYAFEPERRRLQQLKVTGMDPTSLFTSFTTDYSYDNQDNILLSKISKGRGPVSAGSMTHNFVYDNLNRLDTAFGNWEHANGIATYMLGLDYNGLFNLTRKELSLFADPVAATPVNASITYKDRYRYNAESPHRLDQLTAQVNRNNDPSYQENKREEYGYDKKGNNIIKGTTDNANHENAYERKIVWDEENRIDAISVNGYVSHYIYDAQGERTVKLSMENDGVYVNGKFSGRSASIATYSLYASPYYSMRNGNGIFTKHIYIGTQRIMSQVENEKAFEEKRHPQAIDTVRCNNTIPLCSGGIGYANKRLALHQRINGTYAKLELPYEPIKANAFDNPPGYIYQNQENPLVAAKTDAERIPKPADPAIIISYFYHGNQIGSTAFVTDANKVVVQYAEYLPFGETFMEQRNNYSSQFMFSGKEQDMETGLYYFGSRYYDPHTYQWLGSDPKSEKYPAMSAYNYCLNNPVKMMDPGGESPEVHFFDNPTATSHGYDAIVYVVSDEYEISGPYRGSTFPNAITPKDPSGTLYNTLKDGSYTYSNEFGHHGGRDQGLNIVDQNNKRYASGFYGTEDVRMEYANVHAGATNNGTNKSKGSHGCLTIDPKQASKFFENFQWDSRTKGSEKGTLQLNRGDYFENFDKIKSLFEINNKKREEYINKKIIEAILKWPGLES